MNLIDTADIYGFDGANGFGSVEELLGRVFARRPACVTGWCWRRRAASAHRCRTTPRRMRCAPPARTPCVGAIDLYQIHRPDLFAHPADVAATLALREEGKVREVGVSNHTPAQVAALQAHLPFPLVSNQPEYSAAHLAPLRDGTLDACARDGVVPLAWSPLAGGRLATGDGIEPELVTVLDELAAREGCETAARWRCRGPDPAA